MVSGSAKGRKRLTVENVRAAKAGSRDRHVWDSVVSGFALRLRPPSRSHPEGVKSFVFVYRWPAGRDGKKQRITLGSADQWAVGDARQQADKLASQVRQGRDPRAEIAARKATAFEAGNTFDRVADQFLKQHSSQNRSHYETERIFKRYLRPKWGKRPIGSLRRLDVVELLDDIAENNGPVMADRVLAAVRKLFRWHSTRDDTFNSPIVPGMARTRPADRARAHILSDDEIRAVWKAADATPGPYGRLVQFLFLTAARREEAGRATWAEIENDLFVISAERSKSKKPHVVPLSRAALDLLTALPRFQLDGKMSPWVFSHDGRKAFNSHSEAKAALDKASGVKGWVLHDIRRTARSLMSRAGISPDIAERVLNHAIPGVRGVYDRHSYLVEKRHALDALATEISRIIDPTPQKVIPIRRKRKVGNR